MPKPLEVLIFGSSLCRDLETLDERRYYEVRGIVIHFSYKPFSGKSFEHFVDTPSNFDDIVALKPDIILSIFGGNSISSKKSDLVHYFYAKRFYAILRKKFDQINPSTIIVASEIPMRYVYNGYKNTPRPHIFRAIRHRINLKIRNSNAKQFLCRLEGDGRLDKKSLYRDGVHLKIKGQVRHFNIILRTLDYIFEKLF